MARKSKRAAALETPVQEDIYNVAVYIRLSIEDGVYKNGSESLANQRELIFDYLKNKSNMKIYAVYCDNGETGTNFERNEFQRMMYDVYSGRVNCIVVKDLSRFGREYIEAGDYLERIFPLIGVRFIAVNDGYDNHVNPLDITVSIKNIVNTLYARDISKKSSAALRIKQENGEYIGAFAPYGYIKAPSDKHKLIIDEPAASAVRQMFEWKAEGMSYAAISRLLQDMRIPTPNQRKYELGIFKSKGHKNCTYWRPETVKSILLNEVYTGSVVQGRIKSHFYDGGSYERMNKADWIVVKNTHEPIISEDLFNKVQRLCQAVNDNYHSLNGRYKDLGGSENIFRNKILCGDCGKKLSRYKKVNSAKVTYFYICKQHTQHPLSCGFISIREDVLKELVLLSIKEQLVYLLDFKSVLSAAKGSAAVKQKKNIIVKETSKAFSEIAYIKLARIRAASDYARGSLDEDAYSAMSRSYKEKLDEASRRLEAAGRSRERLEDLFAVEKWISETAGYNDAQQLTQDIIDVFIERIRVYPDQRVEIQWTFSDKLHLFRQFSGECGGEKLEG